MNIFFTGSIRGGRADQPNYAFIVRALERHGTVHSQHVSDEALSEYGETGLSAGEILKREKGALEKCDIVVAEVSTSSLGVGYLIAYAAALKKRVIALYGNEDTLKLSAIIKGDPGVEVYGYLTGKDIDKIMAKVFKNQ